MIKNNTLNLIKAIAAISVILIHIKFPGEKGLMVVTLCRFAVPFFFMVSGYYAYQNRNEKNKKNIKKILKLTIVAFVAYFVWKNIYHLYYGDLNNFYNLLTNGEMIKFFFKYNTTIIGGHLWYLPALLYVYIMYYFIDKYKVHNIFYLFIPILLILNIILGEYSLYIGIKGSIYIYRNFLLTGLPFFMLGNFIHKNEDKIFNNKTLFIILIGVFIVSSLVEFKLIGTCDLYLSTILLSTIIFIFGCKNPNTVKEKNLLVIIGEKYSLSIYISQFIIIDIYQMIFYPIPDRLMRYLTPIIIIIITVIVSYLYYEIKNKLKASK